MKANNESGFLGRFKANNISNNRSSIEAIAGLISTLLNEELHSVDDHSLKLKIEECCNIITIIADNNIENSQLIKENIRFGEIFNSILIFHINLLKNETAEKIIVNYLNIAKYLNDGRVNEIAISLAKQIDI